jgi:hypothetical protein
LTFSFVKIAFCPAGRRSAAQGRRQAPGSTLARRDAGWHPPLAVLLAILLSELIAVRFGLFTMGYGRLGASAMTDRWQLKCQRPAASGSAR